MTKKKILAIIPARGGSKGLLNKNLQILNGEPLVYYSIREALKSEFITKIVLTSDSEHILNFAKAFDIELIRRPDSLSLDNTPMSPVVEHCINYYKKNGLHFKYFILLQPTSPLRTSVDIDSAFRALFSAKESSSLISVFESPNSPFKSMVLKDNQYLEGLHGNEQLFKNRQSLPVTYQPNGAIYISEVDSFISEKTFIQKNTIPYIMPRERSIDIDSIIDLNICELALTGNFQQKDHDRTIF